MLARILHSSPNLCAFLDPLIGSLSKPQCAHLQELCDAILVCETTHTLAAMQRLFVDTTDQSNWADFLRISPWNQDAVRAELLKSQIDYLIEHGQKNDNVTEIPGQSLYNVRISRDLRSRFSVGNFDPNPLSISWP